MVIKRIAPMSLAKVAGVVYAGIGLLIGALVSLVSIGGSMFMPEGEGSMFGALIFNAAAGIAGGVEIEVQ